MDTMPDVFKKVKILVTRDGNCPFTVNTEHKNMKCGEFSLANCMSCKLFMNFYNKEYKQGIKNV